MEFQILQLPIPKKAYDGNSKKIKVKVKSRETRRISYLMQREACQLQHRNIISLLFIHCNILGGIGDWVRNNFLVLDLLKLVDYKITQCLFRCSVFGLHLAVAYAEIAYIVDCDFSFKLIALSRYNNTLVDTLSMQLVQSCDCVTRCQHPEEFTVLTKTLLLACDEKQLSNANFLIKIFHSPETFFLKLIFLSFIKSSSDIVRMSFVDSSILTGATTGATTNCDVVATGLAITGEAGSIFNIKFTTEAILVLKFKPSKAVSTAENHTKPDKWAQRIRLRI